MAVTGALGRLKAKVTASLKGRKGAGSGRPSGDASNTGGISISYRPERDGGADPGEVVWAWVPYEDDPSQGKDRPVLILGTDGQQLVGVQLSTKDHEDRRDAHEWIEVGTGAWDSKGRTSYADASRLLRFDPHEIRREGSALDRGRFDVVLARVSQLHDWRP